MGSGEARETQTPAVTLPAGVDVSLENQVIYTVFTVIFCNIGIVLFFYYFFLIQYLEEVLLQLQPQIRKSWDSMENANKKRK